MRLGTIDLLELLERLERLVIQAGFSLDDRLLDVEEASKVLHVSPDWLYRNSHKLPFTRRLGAKALRFSSGKETNVSPELRIRLVDASGFKVPYLGSRVLPVAVTPLPSRQRRIRA